MFNNIKQFIKHSAVYSIGNIATKGIGIITLPIYTKLISVEQFGLLGIIEITIMILVEVLTLGQANSILIFNNSSEFKNQKKSLFFTIIISVVSFNLLFLFALETLHSPLFNLLEINSSYNIYYTLGLAIIMLRVVNLLFLYKLRADEKSVFYTVVTIVKITSALTFIIYFVAYLKLELLGILYAYILSEIISFLIQLPAMLKSMIFKFNKNALNTAFSFGFPLVFGTIGIMFLNLSDRYMLQIYTDLKTVGLYDLGYRAAGVLNMFLIMPFNLTLLPAAYKKFRQPDDKRYYSKLMTYMSFVLVWAGLGLSLISEELIKVFALNSEYWPSYTVVPIIILAYIFSATRNFASLGMLLTKNTKQIAALTLLAAVLNIGLNFWLIPKYGMMASAYNTLFAFVIFHFINKIYSDKFYKITYENLKLIKIFLTGLILFFIPMIIGVNNELLFLLIKIISFSLFPIILLMLKIYEPVEIETIKKIIKNWKNPSYIKKFFNKSNK